MRSSTHRLCQTLPPCKDHTLISQAATLPRLTSRQLLHLHMEDPFYYFPSVTNKILFFPFHFYLQHLHLWPQEPPFTKFAKKLRANKNTYTHHSGMNLCQIWKILPFNPAHLNVSEGYDCLSMAKKKKKEVWERLFLNFMMQMGVSLI